MADEAGEVCWKSSHFVYNQKGCKIWVHVVLSLSPGTYNKVYFNLSASSRTVENSPPAYTLNKYRIQNVFIVNQIKPLYYNMLLFTINVQRKIYFY